MKAIKILVVILPSILFIGLFSIYWEVYILPLNKLLGPGQEVPEGYWTIALVAFVTMLTQRLYLFFRIANGMSINTYYKSKYLLRSFITTLVVILVFGNVMFIFSLFNEIKRNYSLHLLLLIFASLFIIKFIIQKAAFARQCSKT